MFLRPLPVLCWLILVWCCWMVTVSGRQNKAPVRKIFVPAVHKVENMMVSIAKVPVPTRGVPIMVRSKAFGRSPPELHRGKATAFGGPHDRDGAAGTGRKSGLALGENPKRRLPTCLFLPKTDPRTKGKGYGLLRSLNPDAFYVSARWAYSSLKCRRSRSRHDKVQSYEGGFPVLITASNGNRIVAWAVDYGPDVDFADVDLSYGAYGPRGLNIQSGVRVTSIEYILNKTVVLGRVEGKAHFPEPQMAE